MDLKLRYRDDRGGTLAGKPPRAREAAERAGLDRRFVARRLWRLRIFEVAVFTLVCLLVAGAALPLALLPIRPSPAMMIVLPMAIIVFAALVLTLAVRPLGWRLHRAGLLAVGLCPACGYPIAEIEPEADGCRVCPECGSAWKLEEATSPPTS